MPLTLLQHGHQRAQSHGQRKDPDPISLLELAELHLLRRDGRRHGGEHEDAGDEVDVDVPSDIRTHGGRKGGGQPKHGGADGLKVFRHHGDDNGQRRRDEHPAREPLTDPEDNHLAQRVGNAAHGRAK